MKSESRHMRGRSAQAGFTLIELLITVAIFIFMTALIISRYGAFNQGTLMTNLAYDVALSIRTAQSFGVSVKGTEIFNSRSTQSFGNAFAVHFDIGSPTAFFTYVDINDTIDSPPSPIGVYNSAIEGPAYSNYAFKQGAVIKSLCVGSNGQSCSVFSPALGDLDISFQRPDPSAVICVNNGICTDASNSNSPFNYAEVTLSSSDGSSIRKVIVRGNGQIAVK